MLKNIAISKKLPASFVILASVASIAIGMLAYSTMVTTIERSAQDRLQSTTALLSHELYLLEERFKQDGKLLALDFGINSAVSEFNMAMTGLKFTKGDPNAYIRTKYVDDNPHPDGERHLPFEVADTTPYADAHAKWHPFFDSMVSVRGYADLYLINNKGDVVYSWGKRDDYGTNAFEGQWRDTDLAQAVRMALEAADVVEASDLSGEALLETVVAHTPFRPYAALNNQQASFVAVPLLNADGRSNGVIALQIPIEPYAQIMSQELGLGVPVGAAVIGDDGDVVFVNDQMGADESAALGLDLTAFALESDATVGVRENAETGRSALVATDSFENASVRYGLVLQADYRELMRDASRLGIIIIIAVALTILVVSALGYWFARGITKPLGIMTARLVRLAGTGDLRERTGFDGKDEVGASAAALDRLLAVLEDSFASITEETKTLSDAASRLSASSIRAANSAEEQSSAVVELSSSVEQTATQVRANATSAKQAADAVAENVVLIDQGKARVEEMFTSMRDIQAASEKICSIIKAIDEIAFQTNLLALNAAVEAARAGQHGRGFAVVASEVRNLAARSAKAASETADLISDSSLKVTSGVGVAGRTRETFDAITSGVERLKHLVTDISLSSEEQSRGVDLINTSINDLSRAARIVAEDADGLSSTATALTNTGAALRERVDQFTVSAPSQVVDDIDDTVTEVPAVVPVSLVSAGPEMSEGYRAIH